jgi:cell division protein FtsI (penicillin-binding protein 3)
VDLVERRIGLLFAGFLALLLLAAGRAAWLGLVESDRLAQAAVSQQVAETDVPARRGSILDRHGVELAVSEPADDVSATPYLVEDKLGTARRLSPILERPVDELVAKLAQRNGFVYLARSLPAAKAEQVRKLGLTGVDLTPGYTRSYPRRMLASQVLGFVGTEGKGLSGLELRHDEALRGRAGERRAVKDALGDSIEVRDTTRAKPGADVELTIDASIQERVEQVLKALGAKQQPKAATAFVMDPRTSEVLALANWPRVDANDPSAAPPWALQNRAVALAYEPGSTFKSVTVAGALEDGEVQRETKFTLAPQIQVADRTIGESHPRGTETMTTSDILARSSNVGAITIGQRLGKRGFDKWVRRFGFGRPTGVDLPGEEQGILLPVDKYSGSSMGNLPIGHGLLVTPMQMAAAYAAIANGGVLREPRVVRKVGGRPVAHAKGRRVISERTSDALRDMLKGVLAPGGTASEVHIPGYTLAGKTGTANKLDEQTGEYSKSRYYASFIGFAPADDPRLLIGIVVDEPKGSIYGGQVAAPAFGEIASFALPYLGIAPE